MKTTIHAVLSIVAFAGLCAPQGPNAPRGPRDATPGSGLDMTKVQTVAGSVTAVHIGYGMEYPSITVNGVQIKVAPIWYLLEKSFEIKAGDAASVVAAPSISASDAYLYAVEITNTTSKLRIVLRDSNGIPLWLGGSNMGPGNPRGPMAEGGCVDASTVATASGTIENVSMGAGIQMPALTLKTADGSLLVLKLGPERILLAADLELKAGDPIQAKYARASCTEELVALSITTASGVTVVLRGDDGLPVWP